MTTLFSHVVMMDAGRAIDLDGSLIAAEEEMRDHGVERLPTFAG